MRVRPLTRSDSSKLPQDRCGVVHESQCTHREDLFKDAVDEMCAKHLFFPSSYDRPPNRFVPLLFAVPWAMEGDLDWEF